SLPHSAPAPSDSYTLSLHDALPIFEQFAQVLLGAVRLARRVERMVKVRHLPLRLRIPERALEPIELLTIHVVRIEDEKIDVALRDRKSTRLNSSHSQISYAVFCLKK